MLTILHTESSSGWGGQENRTVHEGVGLKRLGDRVIVLCRPEARIKVKAEAAGLEVRTHALRSSFDIGAVRFVMNLIKKEKVDVVSTHSGKDSLICSVAARLSRRRPVIVRTRHLALPITSKTSYSILPHKVVTVSEYVRKYLVEDRGIDRNKVVSIPTGIDLTRFDPENVRDTLREDLGIDKGTPVVGTVAILRRKKGHHLLLDAIPGILKEVPGAIFVFAGEGPQRHNIEAKIKELNLDRHVFILGLRGDVPAVIAGFDLFVLPTLQEALGTSIIEASAMGKAVVATRIGGIPEVVDDNVTGMLVEPENPRALAAAVIKLLKNEKLRKSMGEAGRKLVEREYSTERMVERMHDLYNRLVRGVGN